MSPEASSPDPAPRLHAIAPQLVALAVFVLLAVVHTWPLASNPAHLSRNDNGDAVLNTWAIAWVAHELPRHPTHLFDANIFYPERLTLAQPASYVATYNAILGFPDDASLVALHDRGVTHIVVHADAFRGKFGLDRYGAILRAGSLQPMAADDDIQIFRLR